MLLIVSEIISYEKNNSNFPVGSAHLMGHSQDMQEFMHYNSLREYKKVIYVIMLYIYLYF